MNWKSQVHNLIGDGKKNNTCFYQEKIMEDDQGKKKSTAPSLTFHFAINLSKGGNKEEKVDMHSGGSGIMHIC